MTEQTNATVKRRGRPPKALSSASVTTETQTPPPAPQTGAQEASWPLHFLGERLAYEVEAECGRQFELWGEQNHPLHGGSRPKAGIEYHAKGQENWKSWNAGRVDDDTLGWDGILLEEVFEALTEVDSGAVEEEIVQVIAVCVSLLDSIKRQAAG